MIIYLFIIYDYTYDYLFIYLLFVHLVFLKRDSLKNN